jgi:hypothetical protein
MANNDMCIILHNMIIEDEQDMLKNLRYISKGDLFQPEHDANMIQKFQEMY